MKIIVYRALNYFKGISMPTISRFFGIIISMYWDEHNPPHFHVRFGEYKCSISIIDISVIVGELPKKQERLVLT
jgi:hypothetical protein